jgi:hypothetical protein
MQGPESDSQHCKKNKKNVVPAILMLMMVMVTIKKLLEQNFVVYI